MALASVTAPSNDVMTASFGVLPDNEASAAIIPKSGVDLGGSGEAGKGLGGVDVDEDAVIVDLDLGD